VNGLVLASDGQKMSKRKKNYPDPLVVVNSYGADALRLYLINSPGQAGVNFVNYIDRNILPNFCLPLNVRIIFFFNFTKFRTI
jgi:isoleucyl-tRNA synthetase